MRCQAISVVGEIMKTCIGVSITELVSFLCKSGDIQSRFTNSDPAINGVTTPGAAIRGIQGHQAVRAYVGPDYQSEVPVKLVVSGEKVDLEVSGRIDGVIQSATGVIVEEIKSIITPLQELVEDPRLPDLAQVKCYAYMYAQENDLAELAIRLTYYHMETEEIASFQENYTKDTLASFFFSLIDEYRAWIEMQHVWQVERNRSIARLRFPFTHFREGQSELITSVEDVIRGGMNIFVQAPTGIGKTIAVLFPAIKALGAGEIKKIFYLTAKTVVRTVAEKSLALLREHGLKFKTITLTAKEKICFSQATNRLRASSTYAHRFSCDPHQCDYAKGYYDRIKDALKDIFNHQFITRNLIEKYASHHRICPFEYSLDVSQWCDSIICDFNYAFDPGVYLRRFFASGENYYAFLIDEAHNLVDRAREMFSAELSKRSILALQRATSKLLPTVSRSLKTLNEMIRQKELCEEEQTEYRVEKSFPEWLWTPIKRFTDRAEKALVADQEYSFRDDLITLFFDAIAFLSVMNLYDEYYVTYINNTHDDVIIKLFCIDPSHALRSALTRCKTAVFFSATLTPLDYFVYVLGGDERSIQLRLPSPFPQENLLVLLDSSTSTVYRLRDNSLINIAVSISELTYGKVGNYIAYFPSYEYMHKVRALFCSGHYDIEVVWQKSGMSEPEREAFLGLFSQRRETTLIGFAVMGGIFGEAIDLVGDQLSGVVIVGVGLPSISLEREIIRSYYSELKELGFEYAYIFPGMNRVLQAAGRVIRTETDRGVIVLIDNRFTTPVYRNLLPHEWQLIPHTQEHIDMKTRIREFWDSA